MIAFFPYSFGQCPVLELELDARVEVQDWWALRLAVCKNRFLVVDSNSSGSVCLSMQSLFLK